MSWKKLTIILALIAINDTVSRSQSAEYLIELSLVELMNMEVVVASKKAEKLSDAAGVISVITMDEIERFGGITLRDILERVPSLFGFQSSFSEAYGLSSRGDLSKITSGHLLLLINGRPTREVLEGGVSSEMYAAFPVNIIDRIEVVRGPGSVLYGSNAFNGVINVITKQEEATNASVSALTGIDGAFGANLHATLHTEDLNVLIGGRYMDKGEKTINFSGPDPVTGDAVTDKIAIKDVAKAGLVDIRYKNLSLTSSHNMYEASYFVETAALQGETNKWTKTFTNIGYEANANERWSMDFNFTYNYATFNSGEIINISRKSNDLVFEWNNHIKLGESSRLLIGSAYNYLDAEETIPGGISISKGNYGILSMYSQADVWLWDKFKLIGGIQANKPDDHAIDIVPRLAAVWYPLKRLNVKALYSQAFRSPSINEFNINVPGIIVGNPDLDPEKTRAIDLGLNYQGERFQLGLNYFRNSLKDIISLLYDPTSQSLNYANLESIDFSGAELEGKYYISSSLLLLGSLTYQTSKDQEGNKDVSPIGNLGSKIGFSYKGSKGLTISLFDIYQGNYNAVVPYDGLNPDLKDFHSLNLYSSVNLSNLLDMKKRKLLWFVQADNILNREIWSPLVNPIEATATTLPESTGASIYSGITFEF